MSVSFSPLTPEAERFISQRTGIDYSHGAPFDEKQWFCATITNPSGAIIGVILCEFVNWFEAHFNAASDDPRSTSRRLLRAVFTALFSRVVRLTAFIDTGNGRAVRNAVRLGFWQEGYCRLGINGVTDAYVFGMLKQECPFLPSYVPPSTAGANLPDSILRNIEAHRKIARRFRGSANGSNLVRAQTPVGIDLPSGAVSELIGHVPFSGIPPEMPRVETVSPIAPVAGFVPGRRRTVGALAGKVVDAPHLGRAAPEREHTVAKRITGVRPQDAVVGFGDHGSFEESLGFAVSGHAFSINPTGE